MGFRKSENNIKLHHRSNFLIICNIWHVSCTACRQVDGIYKAQIKEHLNIVTQSTWLRRWKVLKKRGGNGRQAKSDFSTKAMVQSDDEYRELLRYLF